MVMLYLVGLGVCDEKDIPLRGIEACKKADIVFLETYTSPINLDISNLEKLMGKRVVVLSREDVEEKNVVVKEAENRAVVFLVPGDPLFATTHKELVKECKQRNIEVQVIHSSSILTAVGECGLSLYKFGRVVSLPEVQEKYFPLSPYEHAIKNKEMGLHTLILLDIGMSANRAMEILLEMEKKKRKGLFTPETKIVVIARAGRDDVYIAYGDIEKLLKMDFGSLPHCLVLPAELEFHEEEYLKMFEV
jgi:diphthine synthase